MARPALSAELLAANPQIRPRNNYRATPVMVGGVLYTSNGVGLAEAFDPATTCSATRSSALSPRLRAYDKATGHVLWETTLDAGTTGTLTTYLHGGKQYVAIAIGAQNHPPEFIALALRSAGSAGVRAGRPRRLARPGTCSGGGA